MEFKLLIFEVHHDAIGDISVNNIEILQKRSPFLAEQTHDSLISEWVAPNSYPFQVGCAPLCQDISSLIIHIHGRHSKFLQSREGGISQHLKGSIIKPLIQSLFLMQVIIP